MLWVVSVYPELYHKTSTKRKMPVDFFCNSCVSNFYDCEIGGDVTGRKRKQDVPLTPLRVRVHPADKEEYQRIAEMAGIVASELERTILADALRDGVASKTADRLKSNGQ